MNLLKVVAMRQSVEAAHHSQFGAEVEHANQGVRTRQVQGESNDVGAPQGVERIAAPSYGAIRLQPLH